MACSFYGALAIHAMEQVIGIMSIIVLIDLFTDKLFFAPWERLLHHRWGNQRMR
ncbi:hypothetical protein CCP3SC5AM1_210014 [Gammaproteobacteria bacterium]